METGSGVGVEIPDIVVEVGELIPSVAEFEYIVDEHSKLADGNDGEISVVVAPEIIDDSGRMPVDGAVVDKEVELLTPRTLGVTVSRSPFIDFAVIW